MSIYTRDDDHECETLFVVVDEDGAVIKPYKLRAAAKALVRKTPGSRCVEYLPRRYV